MITRQRLGNRGTAMVEFALAATIPCDDFSATIRNNADGKPRAYNKVNASKSFNTAIKMPGIPSGTVIDQTNWIRAR